jgi:hypothetical protein
MRIKNKDSIITQHEFERVEKAQIQIMAYFISGQMNPEVTNFTLRLLGFSAARAKQIVRKWASEKSNTD